MYLKYGDYQHASGEASVVISKQGMFTDAGITRGVRERWDIQGRLQAADPGGIDDRASTHWRRPTPCRRRTSGFYFDNDQPDRAT